jgi:glycosidase
MGPIKLWAQDHPSDDQIDTFLQYTLPRVEARFTKIVTENPHTWQMFIGRLEKHFADLYHLYYNLYADKQDFSSHLENLLSTMASMWFARPSDLKALDLVRERDPLWFQSNQMVGGVCYVDLFADNLKGISDKIPYFKELGITYLHLMPLFRSPVGDNDGGYAISSYREVNPSLGTIQQLSTLARKLREEGISLVLDFVLNHTSNEHEWALRARSGDSEYRDYYYIFPDRTMPNAYERHLREIFPEEHTGSFTYDASMGKWVWTTFHTYQWDLNYSNPTVLNRMAEEMLFLANIGAEVLRMDAVAFIWKELGTNCENLPQAHKLLRILNLVARIASPALLFKSEAIVHPDEVNKYIHPDECQLSYNPLLMALLWNSLATRETRLLRQALQERFRINPACSWVNYVRVHDDIGWTFSDEDAARLGINGYDHRKFLNDFYTGKFMGSFARGLPFQKNLNTGDARISGTCASLAGLEKALREETPHEVSIAIQRILLLHGIIMTAGGIPLIYLGDEIGTLNHYQYLQDPAKANDSRWVHRPVTDWQKVALRHDPNTIQGKIFQGFQKLIRMRVENDVFSGSGLRVVSLDNDHLLAYIRYNQENQILIVANFSERQHTLQAEVLFRYRLNQFRHDLISGKSLPEHVLTIKPYQLLVLSPKQPN